MKKPNMAAVPASELRPEYKRSDFPKLVRGKYAGRLRERSTVVIVDPVRLGDRQPD